MTEPAETVTTEETAAKEERAESASDLPESGAAQTTPETMLSEETTPVETTPIETRETESETKKKKRLIPWGFS